MKLFIINFEYFLDRKLDLPLNSFKTEANAFCNERPVVDIHWNYPDFGLGGLGAYGLGGLGA